MASSTKPGLDPVVTPAATDTFSVRQSGDTRDKRETLAQIATRTLSAGAIPAAGTALSIAASAPTATTGASQVGKAAALAASAAVASTDTAGAAAGGSVAITAGAAARNASGNANGGDVNIDPGAGIGTGAAGAVNLALARGQVVVPLGTKALTALAFTGLPSTGVYSRSNRVTFSVGGNIIAELGNNAQFDAAAQIGWGSGAIDAVGQDATLKRVAPAVVAAADGSSGLGWLQWAGEAYLAADATNATATLATTGLSVTVKSGRKYAFKCVLYVSDSIAAEGAQIDFGGGTATATNFRAHVTGFDTALTINTQLTSLTGVASAGTFTGSGMLEIHGSFEPSANGTFIPRFAQATHAAGTLTLFRGSHLLVWDAP